MLPPAAFATAAAAALAGLAPTEVADLLADLTGWHLLEPASGGRFTLPDLLRVYARDRCFALDPADRRAAATQRLAAWLARG